VHRYRRGPGAGIGDSRAMHRESAGPWGPAVGKGRGPGWSSGTPPDQPGILPGRSVPDGERFGVGEIGPDRDAGPSLAADVGQVEAGGTDTSMSSARAGPETKLAEAMEQCATMAAAYAGVAYRATGPEHAGPAQLLNGRGSMSRGGHWSTRSIAAAYASRDPETALAEAFPLAFVSFRVRLQRALDLLDGRVQALLQDFLDRMAREDGA
jgi:RES domain